MTAPTETLFDTEIGDAYDDVKSGDYDAARVHFEAALVLSAALPDSINVAGATVNVRQRLLELEKVLDAGDQRVKRRRGRRLISTTVAHRRA